MADVTVAVRRAQLPEQEDLTAQPEHCSMDPRTIAVLGVEERQQVRIIRDGRRGLYTVSQTRNETPQDIVRMGLTGRRRLGTEDVFDAVASALILRSVLPDDEAEQAGEFVERLADDGSQRELIVVAPHGGDIEPHTDEQAGLVSARFPVDQVSAWVCKGWQLQGASSYHITSADLNPKSFPLLGRVIDRGFTHAVSFHGFDQPEILVGGGAPACLRREFGYAIAAATTGSGIAVRLAEPNEPFGGDDAANVVNRLTAGGANGVQIEQCLQAREHHGEAIANAVADVYERLLERTG
jgi:phage replication-related protein YjqB (UPF0714/DUF867 family)